MGTLSILHLDDETYSESDLKKCGLYNYARSPMTGVYCVAHAFNDEPIQIWLPGLPVPPRIIQHVQDGLPIWGHNVGFEFEINNQILVENHGWPLMDIEQMFCTMACCFAMGLPGTLEKAAAALGIKKGKDMKGHRIMLQLCKPKSYDHRGKPVYVDLPSKLEALRAYCTQDVEVEREIHRRVLPLSSEERKVWLMDWEINQRGIGIDIKSVRTAAMVAEAQSAELNKEIQKISGNFIPTTNSVANIKQFLAFENWPMESLAKQDIIDTLCRSDVPFKVRKVLELRQEAAKSSVAKLIMMDVGMGKNHRIRNLFQYHAAATGRFGGRRIQPHNLPRPDLKQAQIDGVFKLLRLEADEAREAIEMIYGPPLKVISDCLRGFLVAGKNQTLVALDFAQIEARIVAWLAWEQKVLDEYAGRGKVYEMAASNIYHIPMDQISKKQRQIGKVSELALGFGGGKGAFISMAQNYGLVVGEEEAENIKVNWRKSRPKTVEYWKELERAAINAVFSPGTVFRAGKGNRAVYFKTAGSFLFCKLPSGRKFCYPYPQVKTKMMKWGKLREQLTYMGEGDNHRWERQTTYGGSLCENITQAAARDILVFAMARLKEANYPIVLHVHDEVVFEIHESFSNLEMMEDFIAQIPTWAAGLPLKAEGWIGKRYRK